jgi:hypothetical protein
MKPFHLALLLAACGEVTTGGGGAPTITEISPDRGGMPGGATITISGTNLDSGDVLVIVGDRAATDVAAASDGSLTFTLPPGPEGEVVDVMVVNDSGVALAPDALTYNPAPLVTSLSRSNGPQGGGTTITIRGRGFLDLDPGATTVSFGGATTTDVTIVDDEELTVETPAKTDGILTFERLAVTLSNANGEATVSGGFAYTSAGFLASSTRNTPYGIYFIDPETYDARFLAALPNDSYSRVSSMAFGPDDRLYVTKGYCCSTKRFGTLDPFTATFEQIGTVTSRSGDLAFAGAGLYSYQNNNNAFYSVNLSDGQFTTVNGALGLTGSVKAALAPEDDDSVYLIEDLSGPIRSITTGGVITPGATMNGSGQAHGAAVAGDDTLLVIGYGQGNNESALYEVTISTGEVTEVATYPHNFASLTRVPASWE